MGLYGRWGRRCWDFPQAYFDFGDTLSSLLSERRFWATLSVRDHPGLLIVQQCQFFTPDSSQWASVLTSLRI